MTINTTLLKQRIKELGYTRKGVADRAEISVNTLKKMVSGRYGMPREYLRKRLSKVLEIEEEVLFPGIKMKQAS